jgi:excisionase family DNA binding protein
VQVLSDLLTRLVQMHQNGHMLSTDHLTVAQAAKALNESRWTTARRIRNGELKAQKLDDGATSPYIIRRSDLERLLRKRAAA